MASTLWAGTASCLIVAGIAAWKDRRQRDRVNLDRVGLVPWPAVLIAALIGAATCAAIAIKG